MIGCNKSFATFFIVKGKYVVKDSGSTCTTPTEGHVETFEECKYLKKYVESIYPNISYDTKAETNADYPSGCYIYTKTGNTFGMYFNRAKNGSSNSHSRPLCGNTILVSYTFIYFIIYRYLSPV